MLEVALLALAEAGGKAVVTAAGTDTWNAFRRAMARWFGRGDTRREQVALERLDQAATAVRATDPAQAEQARASWQTRITDLLEDLDEAERQQAASQLQTLLAQHVPQAGVSAGPGGVAVGGDIRAEGGSVASGVVQGDVHVGPPPKPGPPQG